MTAEQQLERSVLEGKERDELSAIAQAMSLKTTTRTKKADIIDQILDATGVTSGSNGAGTPAGGSNGARRPRNATPAGHDNEGEAPAAAPAATAGDAGAPAPASDSSPAEAAAPVATATVEAAPAGNSGPAVFVEPPELADGAVTT